MLVKKIIDYAIYNLQQHIVVVYVETTQGEVRNVDVDSVALGDLKTVPSQSGR